jgi:D-alanine-D-alanine ligase
VAKKTLRIGVLVGGRSSERDVSFASGYQVVQSLRTLGHDVWTVDTAQGGLTLAEEQQRLTSKVGATPSAADFALANEFYWCQEGIRRNLDLWFNALHGGAGEDGRIQGLLSMTGIPYTGSGVLASALAMDKDMTKHILRTVGVSTPSWCMAPLSAEMVSSQLGWPVVVKPSKQGSTVGLSVVRHPDQLQEAIIQAGTFDDEVMVEQFIPGRELTCPVLGDQALIVGEIILQRSEIFDYEAKYQAGAVEEVFPAKIPDELAENVQRAALTAHRALKCQGASRSDFRLDELGKLWCLEVNTQPGLTAMSLLPQSAEQAGISFDDLIQTLCDLALQSKT